MTDLARVLPEIEKIKQLKARYFRGVDSKDEALLASVFCKDATVDFRGGMQDSRGGEDQSLLGEGEYMQGAATIAAAIMKAVAPLITVHHGHMPEIEVTADGEATGVWAMVDHLLFPEGGDIAEIIGWGHYHETYRKVDGEWKIATLRLTRLRLDVRPAG